MTPVKTRRKSIVLLLMKARFKGKKETSIYTIWVGSHAEMMRQYYGARISLGEMEKPIASVASAILDQGKENDHITGVAAEIEMEPS